MKARVDYRPRLVLKRQPDNLDREEIGIAYDVDNHVFHICPPDLSSDDDEELDRRWRMFFDFIFLIPSFEFDESWLEHMGPRINESYQRTKACSND